MGRCPAHGPGDRTYDQATGLFWLDLTETTNLSYNAVVGGAGGRTTQGWRHATLAEVCQLFSSYAIAPATPCGSGNATQPGDGVRGLQALLGITRFFGTQQEDTFGFADNGTPGPNVGRGQLTYQIPGAFSLAGVLVNSGFGPGDALTTHGHFLVRTNQPPVANAGPDQSIFVDEFTGLAGSATDPDGDEIVAWEWTVESSPAGSNPLIQEPWNPTSPFSGDVPGDYVLALIASDGTDWSAPDQVNITVAEVLPPVAVAVADADVTTGPAPLTVSFDGSQSYDPQGGTLSYDWDFGDGSAAPGVSPTHEYLFPGTYTAQLTVIDRAPSR